MIDRGESEFILVDIALLPNHRNANWNPFDRDLLAMTSAGKPVTLNVWHSNPPKNLYQRMGFSVANDDGGVYCEMRWNPDLAT